MPAVEPSTAHSSRHISGEYDPVSTGRGAAALDPSGTGTSSPLGPVTGTTYVAADDSFFYANLTPVNQPSQREFIYGGTPVNPQFYQATASTPGYLAFNVQPDAALQSSIPFIRLPTGGSLGSSASVSPLILATPLNTNFATIYGDTKALQASLAVIGAGAGQQSVIVVLVGNAFGSPPDLAGVIHGSYLANAVSQPVRINTYFEPPLDSANNRFYGGNSISGFVLAPGSSAANAVEVNTATQATTATYQFAQPVTATSVPQSVAAAPQTSQTLSGWFGGIMTKQAPGGSGQPLPYAVAGNTSITTNASHSSSQPPCPAAIPLPPAPAAFRHKMKSCCSLDRPITVVRLPAKLLSTTIYSRRLRARPPIRPLMVHRQISAPISPAALIRTSTW